MSKVKYPKIVHRNYTEEDMPTLIDHATKGNIPALLELVLHNQAVINEKLNKIVDKK